ncbi:hypothetical protein G7B40_019430 [Aetokthonos hydrillicola Thurmond2011]|jgi:hypothetical protein|uniref:DUF6888 domain-containing protein n=1 Tax=Aetokthonos hydrillicola Thurmond2011 TaxID=2712845 RepID=A0AAP5MB58_9CYAN|nr:hypothetical protein [Aetokthonos hydrillicola]MBW4587259.1 hypothetical protein [Aetokthonos hydrillicola CCALA 1050]MDR9896718.1 hypothetical protein [Aetokthonos hydrillicola Thurmond2011]
MEPTPEQMKECYRICTELTKMFLSVHLVRLDKRTGEVYILAGDGLQVLIRSNGKVRFL